MQAERPDLENMQYFDLILNNMPCWQPYWPGNQQINKTKKPSVMAFLLVHYFTSLITCCVFAPESFSR